MRFVSHSPGLMVGVIEEKVHFGVYGDRIVDREGYIAIFKQDFTDADVEFAERVFVQGGLVNGRTTLVDEVTWVPITDRLSTFDTDEQAALEKWDERVYVDNRGVEHDYKTHVEQTLLERSLGSSDFKLIEQAVPAPPWPNYLDFKGELDDLIAKIETDGYDLGKVLAYEEQVGKRPQVIEALQAAMETNPQAIPVGA